MDLGRLASARRLAQQVRIGPLGQLSDLPFNLRTLAEAGVIRPLRPDKLVRVAHELARWGASPAAGVAGGAITDPQRPIVIDEAGSLTYAEMDRRSNALARGLSERGVGPGDGIAIMCRNHRGFVESTLAVSKLGAGGLYMNTAFSGPQLAGVVERERPAALIYDEEFSDLLAEAGEGLLRLVAWPEDGAGDDPALDDADRRHRRRRPRPARGIEPVRDPDLGHDRIAEGGPARSAGDARTVGGDVLADPDARRRADDDRRADVSLLGPCPPHARPLARLDLRARRRFDPERTLRAVQEHGATALIVVPVMLQRILELPAYVLDRYPLPSLRVTAASGSALPGSLAIEWMDRFGDNLYNLYGSTEVAWATIATPEDLRAAPGTAGLPPRGTAVKIVDPEGAELPAGRTGRVFVGNEMAFEGYTGGGGKEIVEGLLSSGDVGHFDRDGRLFIDGRDDEMIVSGGENVFPREVEDLLAAHAAIAEVAVIGVDDDEFGQRLKAFVVLRERDSLGEDELQEHVKRNLARYKVPREIVFLDSLPRNATGKVLKRELS